VSGPICSAVFERLFGARAAAAAPFVERPPEFFKQQSAL
jgi:hypothetical protein